MKRISSKHSHGNHQERVGYWIGVQFRRIPQNYRRLIYLLSLPFWGPLWLFWYFLIRVDDREWRQNYPELEKYWTVYPQTKTNAGTRCYYCGSNRIDSYLWRGISGYRVHYCHQCRKDLYRTSE